MHLDGVCLLVVGYDGASHSFTPSFWAPVWPMSLHCNWVDNKVPLILIEQVCSLFNYLLDESNIILLAEFQWNPESDVFLLPVQLSISNYLKLSYSNYLKLVGTELLTYCNLKICITNFYLVKKQFLKLSASELNLDNLHILQ